MQQFTDPACDQLAEKIRRGDEADNPMLISLWLTATSANPANASRRQLRAKFEAQFRLLLETIVDELVPAHWRMTCLDHVYRPLSSLQRISDCAQSEQQIRCLLIELSVNCRYVKDGLHP